MLIEISAFSPISTNGNIIEFLIIELKIYKKFYDKKIIYPFRTLTPFINNEFSIFTPVPISQFSPITDFLIAIFSPNFVFNELIRLSETLIPSCLKSCL